MEPSLTYKAGLTADKNIDASDGTGNSNTEQTLVNAVNDFINDAYTHQ